MSQPEALSAMNDAIKAIDSVFRTNHRLSIEAIEQLAEAREGLREAVCPIPSLFRTYERLYHSVRCPGCGGGDAFRKEGHFANCPVEDFRLRLRNADDVLRRLSVKSVQAYIENWYRGGGPVLDEKLSSLAQQIVLALKGEHEGGV